MIKFGTGGWRGLIGKDFIYDNICRAAQGIADMIKEDGRQATPVMLGFDRRFLSFDAAQWIAQTLCANGITVWFMKRTAPTPLIMHTVMAQGLFYGVQVRHKCLAFFIDGREAQALYFRVCSNHPTRKIVRCPPSSHDDVAAVL